MMSTTSLAYVFKPTIVFTNETIGERLEYFFLHSIIQINGLCKALSLMIDLAEVLMTALCFVFCVGVREFIFNFNL